MGARWITLTCRHHLDYGLHPCFHLHASIAISSRLIQGFARPHPALATPALKVMGLLRALQLSGGKGRRQVHAIQLRPLSGPEPGPCAGQQNRNSSPQAGH